MQKWLFFSVFFICLEYYNILLTFAASKQKN